MSHPKVTVAICTYNRCASLASTLRTLEMQDAEALRAVEILVVNNNCTDETSSVVERFADRLPIVEMIEHKQGLSHARNRAMLEAGGDWVLFTDDDVLLTSGWLSSYLAAFRAYPGASFAGGRILPFWEKKPPAWFKGRRLDLIDGLLVWYDMGGVLRSMGDNDPLPFGASFAIRRSLSRTVGEFRSDLGVNGKSMGRGEETEFVERAKFSGATGIYVGTSVCYHVADPRRFSPIALYRHGRAKAVELSARHVERPRGSLIAAFAFLCRGFWQLLKGRGDRFRQCLIHVGIQHGLKKAPD